MSNRPIAIDLFAGCGGMSLGLEAAGFDIAVAIEFDAVHSVVHHFNFPYCETICKDISKVETNEIISALKKRGYRQDVDLIAGGPPCQGFSHIGKRQLDDPRNQLVFQYLRIVKEIKPKYFIFENVPGIGSGEHKKFLEELLSEFKNLGYDLSLPVQILDASVYGAPQKRRRLIIIGSRLDVVKADYPKPDHSVKPQVHGLFENSVLIGNTVADAISDLEKIPAYTGTDKGIQPNQLDYVNFRSNFDIIPKGFYKRCHIRSINPMIMGHVGSVHTEESTQRFRNSPSNETEPKSRFFKLSPNGFCNTLRAGTNSDKGAYTAPRPIHYSIPRCITVREAARLHTYPDWFQFHKTIWHGFREIGNSVIPLLAYKLGLQIMKHLVKDESQLEIMVLPKVSEDLLSMNITQASSYWGINDDVIAKRKRLLNGKV